MFVSIPNPGTVTAMLLVYKTTGGSKRLRISIGKKKEPKEGGWRQRGGEKKNIRERRKDIKEIQEKGHERM